MHKSPSRSLLSVTALFALIYFVIAVSPDSVHGSNRFRNPLKREVLTDRKLPEKPFRTVVGEGVRRDSIVVKFSEGTDIRLRDGRLISLRGHDLGELRALLAQYRILEIRRAFVRPEQEFEEEKRRLQEVKGEELADFNLYYVFKIDPDKTEPEAFINDLNALDVVEIARPQSIPVPFVAGVPYDIYPATPDFSGSGFQYYLDDPPFGIGARWAWETPPYSQFSRGENVSLFHVEYLWNLNHEDLELYPSDLISGTVQSLPLDLDAEQHETAVIGEIIGYDNAYGITGIANKTDIKLVSGYHFVDQPFTAAIDFAASKASPGDVLLLTVGEFGPTQDAQGNPLPCDTTCDPGGSNCYGVPYEYFLEDFDAVKAATDKGVILVEAAGNGQADLDHPVYGGRFNRTSVDSGAIIVGAGHPPYSGAEPLSPTCWSNHGSRVDVQGWGEWVMTTGYGKFFDGDFDEQNPGGAINDENQYYSYFSGTSAAAPIVASAAAVIQGHYKNTLGWTYGLSPYTMRKLLTETGTPQQVQTTSAPCRICRPRLQRTCRHPFLT